MKEKVNQMFKNKLFLIMLVLGLLTIVTAAGVVTVQRGKSDETNPYPEVPQSEMIAQKTAPEMLQVAGASDATKETQRSESAPTKATMTQNANRGNDLAAEAGARKGAADALVLNFTGTSKMEQPVKGNVLLSYGVDRTIYFPTLDRYKYNPGLVIQSDVSTPASVPANAKVLEVGSNEEVGSYVVMDLGNEYIATCGQLKKVYAVEGEYLRKGQTLSYMSEPAEYYSAKGINVFFELKHQDKTVNPSDCVEQDPEHYRENVDDGK